MTRRQERIKKILELCAEGYCYAEVAAIVGCTKSAIAGVISRDRGYKAPPKPKRGRPPRKPAAPLAVPAWQSRFLRPQDRRASR